MLHLYRLPGLGPGAIERIRRVAKFDPGPIRTEYCFNIETSRLLTQSEMAVVMRHLATSYMPEGINEASFIDNSPTILEVGPQMRFQTVQSSTTVSMFHDCGLTAIERIERSVRLGLEVKLSREEGDALLAPLFKRLVFDKMTQQRYYEPLTTFETGIVPKPVYTIPVLSGGLEALKAACGPEELGLSFDDSDYAYLLEQYLERLRRDPTCDELFFEGQEMSDHCSHFRWNGLVTIDGVPTPNTLFGYAKAPYQANPGNSLNAFGDEAAAFLGRRPVTILVPEHPGEPSVLVAKQVLLHPAITEESHCHPSKVDPEQGGGTGKARIRDNGTVGRGAYFGVGHNGIAVGNLFIPGYDLVWEEKGWKPIGAVESLEIALNARKGAFFFGNCVGEPELGGWFISFGLDPGDGYRGYLGKPIFFTGGISLLPEEQVAKPDPEPGMLLVVFGGPAYDIGVGGGSRSSASSSIGDNIDRSEVLDYNSVQRMAPEMQQRGNRVIVAAINRGKGNYFVTLGDCGAGGIMTKAAELAKRCGLRMELRDIPSGDETMTTLVLENNESQERYLGAIREESLPLFWGDCEREGCPAAVIGRFTGDGMLVVHDSKDDTTPINIPLDLVFGARPQKKYELTTIPPVRHPLELPNDLTMMKVLDRVARHPTVACKGWLTNRVDRSVTGRSAQQSCIGPWHLPASDYWVMANSPLDTLATAEAVGVQPHAGLNSPEAMARVSLTEALLQLSGARISDISDINIDVNWFSAAHKPGEGVVLDLVARTLAEKEIEARIRQAGGKDSSHGYNLAFNPCGEEVEVKWPVTVVVTAAAQMDDLNHKVTPLLEGQGELIHVDLSPEYKPLGSSILSQVFGQTGDDCPDVDFARTIACFQVDQSMLDEGAIKSLHDISDGGLAMTLLEMAFISGAGLRIVSNGQFPWLNHYFSQVPGVVVACEEVDTDRVISAYQQAGLTATRIATYTCGTTKPIINVHHNGELVMTENMLPLRQIWLETSFRMDEIQANPECIDQEREVMATLLTSPPFRLTYDPDRKPREIRFKDVVKAGILRAPGTNGDSEMAAYAYMGGFTPVDVNLDDLCKGRCGLDDIQASMPAGGFSYMDEPLESGVAWAAIVEENQRAAEQYNAFFRERTDTLSWAVCNICQAHSLLGIVPDQALPRERRPRFLANESGQFESRFVTVQILPSPAVMFQGMAGGEDDEEGSRLGIIVAHGEGRLFCPDPSVLEWILSNHLAPMRYVDMNGQITQQYPFNPNGSPEGIAGLCTPDGRHVVTMPHIERLFQLWQWPWMPKSWQKYDTSPWMRPIQNMYQWCLEHRS